MKFLSLSVVSLLSLKGLAQLYGNGGGGAPASASTSSAVVAAAAASPSGVITVQVSDSQSSLSFTPDTITANVGQQVMFVFNPANHSVGQAAFNAPCAPMAGGFFSGFQPMLTESSDPTTFTITINDTNPIWFYCGQTIFSHCQSGMVGVINPPSSGDTLAAFMSAAAGVGASTVPAEMQGGILSTLSQAAQNSTTSSGSASGSSSAATSGGSISTFSTLAVFGVVAVIAGILA